MKKATLVLLFILISTICYAGFFEDNNCKHEHKEGETYNLTLREEYQAGGLFQGGRYFYYWEYPICHKRIEL